MARARKPSWSLDPAEVSDAGSRVNRSGRRKATHSRSLDVTEAAMTLRHEPTGIEVSGAVPPGHYTRQRMRQMQDELRRQLFGELERRVAKHLRIPGR